MSVRVSSIAGRGRSGPPASRSAAWSGTAPRPRGRAAPPRTRRAPPAPGPPTAARRRAARRCSAGSAAGSSLPGRCSSTVRSRPTSERTPRTPQQHGHSPAYPAGPVRSLRPHCRTATWSRLDPGALGRSLVRRPGRVNRHYAWPRECRPRPRCVRDPGEGRGAADRGHRHRGPRPPGSTSSSSVTTAAPTRPPPPPARPGRSSSAMPATGARPPRWSRRQRPRRARAARQPARGRQPAAARRRPRRVGRQLSAPDQPGDVGPRGPDHRRAAAAGQPTRAPAGRLRAGDEHGHSRASPS